MLSHLQAASLLPHPVPPADSWGHPTIRSHWKRMYTRSLQRPRDVQNASWKHSSAAVPQTTYSKRELFWSLRDQVDAVSASPSERTRLKTWEKLHFPPLLTLIPVLHVCHYLLITDAFDIRHWVNPTTHWGNRCILLPRSHFVLGNKTRPGRARGGKWLVRTVQVTALKTRVTVKHFWPFWADHRAPLLTSLLRALQPQYVRKVLPATCSDSHRGEAYSCLPIVRGGKFGSDWQNCIREQMSLKSWFLRSYSSTWAARWEFTMHTLVLWNLNLMATPPLLPWKIKIKMLVRSFYTTDDSTNELRAVDKPDDIEADHLIPEEGKGWKRQLAVTASWNQVSNSWGLHTATEHSKQAHGTQFVIQELAHTKGN